MRRTPTLPRSNTMSITSSAVLTELNISVWTANKLDKGATDNVTNNASAVKDAAQVRKNLMAGTHQRKAIADYAASCRLWHNTQTLPWADKGARLMPTSLFLGYKSGGQRAPGYLPSRWLTSSFRTTLLWYVQRTTTWATCSMPRTTPMLRLYAASSGSAWCSARCLRAVTSDWTCQRRSWTR
jgi:hypothetical protein